MNPERWQQIQAVFEQAAQCDAGERESFLAQACVGDAGLRAEVAELLAHDAGARDIRFLEDPSAVSSSPPSSAQATTVVPGYEILELLGEGGMGRVFKARQLHLDRIVALKVIHRERLAKPDGLHRFQREARALARLVHPNIVTIHHAAEHAGIYFLAMEYVAGVDLARCVKQRGPLPVALACEYVRQAALGLQHAFEHGLVHRDIKPANLLLSSPLTPGGNGVAGDDPSPPLSPRGRGVGGEGGMGVVKILDLGLARLHATEEGPSSMLTQEGAVMGTLDFLAPEQALDAHRVDIRADLYSLGCTLYYLLTGRVPFPGGSAAEKIHKHQAEWPVPAEELRPEVPAGVAALLRKLLAKRPEQRYQTPGEVAAALLPFCPAPLAESVTDTPADSGERAAPKPARPGVRFFRTARLLGARPGARWAAIAGMILLAFLLGLLLGRSGRPTPAVPQERITNTLGMKLVHIPAGKFIMGSGSEPPEGPEHVVEITRPFYIGATEVTVGQFRQFAQATGYKTEAEKARDARTWQKPGFEQADDHPVVLVSWNDAQEFCNWLSAKEGEIYRLPTEAEWEYCCRAGTTTAYCFGDDASDLKEYGWYEQNAGNRTHPVGKLKPNAWGLYDVHGNAWEWCQDWYATDYYVRSPRQDPEGPGTGDMRVLRGGGWSQNVMICRAADRHKGNAPSARDRHIGFRVLMRSDPSRVGP